MNNATASSGNCPPHCSGCRLRQTDAFMVVKPEELAFIEAFRSGTSVVPAGGTVIYEQKSNGKLFTLYSGWAFRFKTLSDGRRQILNFLLPGDFIGLQQEFSEGAMHGIEAVTDVALCVFPSEGLWKLFREHPRLGYDITWLAARGEGMVDDGNVRFEGVSRRSQSIQATITIDDSLAGKPGYQRAKSSRRRPSMTRTRTCSS